eukprot:CAMPEP_0194327020 /NCGR_PEP_ID=MMETSP0171-20130528/39307_1 /TAXON_ID=218684 /ORGANISM="Corethron pennatum, Strain L29A3" /LENGTH=816 /DNA_ID=CAMNT_0039086811 /DNA_START=115 /DNA_END=2562 /DNA_ORIENTATION=+
MIRENADAYDDSCYKHCISSCRIPGLCNNFSTAATLLRIARDELRVDLIADGSQIVEEFYSLLQNIESYMVEAAAGGVKVCDKFIVEIEGLDGSGKTTLCQSLTDAINEMLQGREKLNKPKVRVMATKTPSRCLKKIRPLWDHRGGILARAFYMISNYVLEYEICTQISDDVKVIIIDRWYASTLAYTVAYNDDNKNNDEINITSLSEQIFEWPRDLLIPDLLLILNIDPVVRRQRVERRKAEGSGASQFNPWDDRLSQDLQLGSRILQALSRITKGPKRVADLDANASMQGVLRETLGIFIPAYEKYAYPQEYFRDKPLDWWKYECSVEGGFGLCEDDGSGKQCRHVQRNFQIAYHHDNNDHATAEGVRKNSTVPVLKTVVLDRINSECIYYWTPSSSILSRQENFSSSSFLRMASCLWTTGDYPTKQQWRAEGFITRVTSYEQELFRYDPPLASLFAHIRGSAIAAENSGDGDDDATDGGIIEQNTANSNLPRPTRQKDYNNIVEKSRQEADESSICVVRFVPLRVEVFRGSPSSRMTGYPQQWEWVRTKDRSTRENDDERQGQQNWDMRSTLQSTTSAMTGPFAPLIYNQLGITLVLTGCHASGKTTIGKALAKILGWTFEPELGEILRQNDMLQPGGHMYGDGSGLSDQNGNKDLWDDRIFLEEVHRDLESSKNISSHCRVVETWHVGNAKWYALRQKANGADIDIERYKTAVINHQAASVVLLVNLNLPSSSVMLDRRKAGQEDGLTSVQKRLPLKDEEKECEELYQALQLDCSDEMLTSSNIPMIQIENGDDGPEAMERTLKSILLFLQR